MVSLNITEKELSDSAARMRDNKGDIDAKLAECKAIVDNLAGSGFVTDQASGKFDEVHTEFVNAATELMENLDLLAGWMDKAVGALRAMDTRLAVRR
jgi:uncharacterized protein YukE